MVACKLGRFYVNGKQMLDVNYVLKNADYIDHWGHRHEHPFKKTLKDGSWSKEYICMVEGDFPYDEIECNEPMDTLVISMGIQCIRPDGKTAHTRFKKLWSDGKRSVLSVSITTGRTHQIRVHAQFLGYPIVGDRIYNSTVWGSSKGKGAEYGKSYEELCADVRAAHCASNWHETVDPEYASKMERMAAEELEPEAIDLQPQDRPTYDPICLNCNVTKKEIPSDHFQLYLHCLKYSTEKWSYSTPLPEWAIQPEPS
ncbi:RNA pseudouridine synthase [Cooperia oncophora]